MLRFTGDEMKNHTPLTVPIPEDLVGNLDEYLTVHRPILAQERYQGQRLWIVKGGRPQTPHAMYKAITKRTRKAFGAHINPHLFRDCAATALAIDDPENVRISQHVLGHNTYLSTQRNYNLSRSIDASRKINEALLRRKRDGSRKRR